MEDIKPYLPFGLDAADSAKDAAAQGILYNMTLNSLASYVGKHLDEVKLEKIINNLNGIQAEPPHSHNQPYTSP